MSSLNLTMNEDGCTPQSNSEVIDADAGKITGATQAIILVYPFIGGDNMEKTA